MILDTFDKIYVDQASYNQPAESGYINIALYLWDTLRFIREKDIFFILFSKNSSMSKRDKNATQMTFEGGSFAEIYGMTRTPTERSTGSCLLFQLILRLSLCGTRCIVRRFVRAIDKGDDATKRTGTAFCIYVCICVFVCVKSRLPYFSYADLSTAISRSC